MRSSGAWMTAGFERVVDVDVPGGAIGRAGAMMVLAAADAAWVLGRSGLDWRRQRDEFRQKVHDTYQSRVLLIESRYQVRGKDGATTNLVWRGLGFRDRGMNVVTTAEAVEPWLFDSAIADALDSERVSRW